MEAPQGSAARCRGMGVLAHIKKLDDALGHFLVQITYKCGAQRIRGARSDLPRHPPSVAPLWLLLLAEAAALDHAAIQ